MRRIIPIVGILILALALILACDDYPKSASQTAEPSPLLLSSTRTLTEKQVGDGELVLPVMALRSRDLLILDELDPKTPVFLTRQDDGTYRGSIAGIVFILGPH